MKQPGADRRRDCTRRGRGSASCLSNAPEGITTWAEKAKRDKRVLSSTSSTWHFKEIGVAATDSNSSPASRGNRTHLSTARANLARNTGTGQSLGAHWRAPPTAAALETPPLHSRHLPPCLRGRRALLRAAALATVVRRLGSRVPPPSHGHAWFVSHGTRAPAPGVRRRRTRVGVWRRGVHRLLLRPHRRWLATQRRAVVPGLDRAPNHSHYLTPLGAPVPTVRRRGVLCACVRVAVALGCESVITSLLRACACCVWHAPSFCCCCVPSQTTPRSWNAWTWTYCHHHHGVAGARCTLTASRWRSLALPILTALPGWTLVIRMTTAPCARRHSSP